MSTTVWMPTLGLRWRRVEWARIPGTNAPFTKDVLEQKWVSDDYKLEEWRPVPVDMSCAETPK